VRLFDAHNHLQDDRFGGRQEELLAGCRRAGIRRMVVNGACESDWPQVLALARAHPEVLPSFGYHPWYLGERTPEWERRLNEFLDAVPSAVGEAGLDRWKPDLPYDGQEEAFRAQLRIAAERNLPISIHCLQTWGRLLELLRAGPRPACGFLLHSFGGPAEVVRPLARLGAYFSFPGYYAQERKLRQRETFKSIPRDRLLIETDAPDQPLPDHLVKFRLADPTTGRTLNHRANLGAVYEFLAGWLGESPENLAAQVDENFLGLFGGVNQRAG
jgi:TatD DNase family protein